MLTVRRFKALTGSYGARLERWPESERRDARRLLEYSAEAQQLREEARNLDLAIEATGDGRNAPLRHAEEHSAELNRLRARVTQQISRPLTENHRVRPRLAWKLAEAAAWTRLISLACTRLDWAKLRWVGLTTGSSVIIAAGLLIGWIQASEPVPVDLIPLLESTPSAPVDE